MDPHDMIKSVSSVSNDSNVNSSNDCDSVQDGDGNNNNNTNNRDAYSVSSVSDATTSLYEIDSAEWEIMSDTNKNIHNNNNKLLLLVDDLSADTEKACRRKMIENNKSNDMTTTILNNNEQVRFENKYSTIIPGLFDNCSDNIISTKDLYNNKENYSSIVPEARLMSLVRMVEEQHSPRDSPDLLLDPLDSFNSDQQTLLINISDDNDVESNLNDVTDDDDEHEIVFEQDNDDTMMNDHHNENWFRNIRQSHALDYKNNNANKSPRSIKSTMNTTTNSNRVRDRSISQRLTMSRLESGNSRRIGTIATPLTDLSDDDDNNNINDDDISDETVLAKNTDKSSIDSGKRHQHQSSSSSLIPTKKQHKVGYFPFLFGTRRSKEINSTKLSIEEAKAVALRNHQIHIMTLRENSMNDNNSTTNNGEKKKTNSNRSGKKLELNMKNVIIVLLIITQIIVLSTIWTSYVGTKLVLQKSNVSSLLSEMNTNIQNLQEQQQQQQQQQQSTTSSSYNDNNNNVNQTQMVDTLLSSYCHEQHEALFQLRFTFDMKPENVGIVLKDSSGKYGAAIWEFESVFQSFTQAERTNMFSICLSRYITYSLHITDSKCNGLVSYFDSNKPAIYGSWDIMYDGYSLVNYNGNCSASKQSSAIMRECGDYSACSYNISNSGIRGNCSTAKTSSCLATDTTNSSSSSSSGTLAFFQKNTTSSNTSSSIIDVSTTGKNKTKKLRLLVKPNENEIPPV